MSKEQVCTQHWYFLLRLPIYIVIHQLLPSDRTEPWVILHSNIPRKTEWQKPEEINQT